MRTRKPTPEQLQALHAFHLEERHLPNTFTEARELLKYISQGKSPSGEVGKRVAYFRTLFDEWVTSRVQKTERTAIDYQTTSGTVINLVARKPEEINRIIISHGGHPSDEEARAKVCPFLLKVRWDDGRVSARCVSFTERIH